MQNWGYLFLTRLPPTCAKYSGCAAKAFSIDPYAFFNGSEKRQCPPPALDTLRWQRGGKKARYWRWPSFSGWYRSIWRIGWIWNPFRTAVAMPFSGT